MPDDQARSTTTCVGAPHSTRRLTAVQVLSYTGDFADWRRLAQEAAADVAGRLDLLIEWAPRVAYVLSVTVLLL